MLSVNVTYILSATRRSVYRFYTHLCNETSLPFYKSTFYKLYLFSKCLNFVKPHSQVWTNVHCQKSHFGIDMLKLKPLNQFSLKAICERYQTNSFQEVKIFISFILPAAS